MLQASLHDAGPVLLHNACQRTAFAHMLEGIHIACQASLSHGRLPTWWDADHAATISVSAEQRGVTHDIDVFRS